MLEGRPPRRAEGLGVVSWCSRRSAWDGAPAGRPPRRPGRRPGRRPAAAVRRGQPVGAGWARYSPYAAVSRTARRCPAGRGVEHRRWSALTAAGRLVRSRSRSGPPRLRREVGSAATLARQPCCASDRAADRSVGEDVRRDPSEAGPRVEAATPRSVPHASERRVCSSGSVWWPRRLRARDARGARFRPDSTPSSYSHRVWPRSDSNACQRRGNVLRVGRAWLHPSGRGRAVAVLRGSSMTRARPRCVRSAGGSAPTRFRLALLRARLSVRPGGRLGVASLHLRCGRRSRRRRTPAWLCRLLFAVGRPRSGAGRRRPGRPRSRPVYFMLANA
jgi:hypothetical protein